MLGYICYYDNDVTDCSNQMVIIVIVHVIW